MKIGCLRSIEAVLMSIVLLTINTKKEFYNDLNLDLISCSWWLE